MIVVSCNFCQKSIFNIFSCLLCLVPTAAMSFIVLSDEIWSPQIHRQSIPTTYAPKHSHHLCTFSSKLIVCYKKVLLVCSFSIRTSNILPCFNVLIFFVNLILKSFMANSTFLHSKINLQNTQNLSLSNHIPEMRFSM